MIIQRNLLSKEIPEIKQSICIDAFYLGKKLIFNQYKGFSLLEDEKSKNLAQSKKLSIYKRIIDFQIKLKKKGLLIYPQLSDFLIENNSIRFISINIFRNTSSGYLINFYSKDKFKNKENMIDLNEKLSIWFLGNFIINLENNNNLHQIMKTQNCKTYSNSQYCYDVLKNLAFEVSSRYKDVNLMLESMIDRGLENKKSLKVYQVSYSLNEYFSRNKKQKNYAIDYMPKNLDPSKSVVWRKVGSRKPKVYGSIENILTKSELNEKIKIRNNESNLRSTISMKPLKANHDINTDSMLKTYYVKRSEIKI